MPIHKTHVCYPALISSNNSSGTGFTLRYKGSIYFITAKHVLFNGDKLSSTKFEVLMQDQDFFNNDVWIFNIDVEKLIAANNFYPSSGYDVCAFKFSEIVNETQVKTSPGVSLISKGPTQTISILEEGLLQIEDVAIGNDIYVYGYPTSLSIDADKYQFNPNKPLIKRGIVAGLNLDLKTIILDCSVYPGNSGGPVIQASWISAEEQKHELIGVVIQFVPYHKDEIMHNSGYSVAVSIDVVIDMIK